MALRVAVVVLARHVPTPGPDPTSDTRQYFRLGQAWASGHLQRGDDRHLDLFWPPGYPAFLGIVLKARSWLAGWVPARVAIGAAQTVLSAWSVLLVGLFVRRTTGSDRLALLSAGLLAVWPSDVLATAVVLSEQLFTPLLLTALVVLLWDVRPSARRSVVAGVLLGMAGLTRTAAMPIVLAAALMLACGVGLNATARVRDRGERRTAVSRAALLLAGAMVVVVPWLIAGYHETGRLQLSTSTGFNLCAGNSAASVGEYEPAPCRTPLGTDIATSDDRLRDRAMDFVADHPLRQAAISVRRLASTLVQGDRIFVFASPGVIPYRLPLPRALGTWSARWWTAMLALSVVSIATGGLRSRRRITVLLGLTALVLLAPLVSYGDPRYHVPLVPGVAILTAIALDRAWTWGAGRQLLLRRRRAGRPRPGGSTGAPLRR